MNKVMSYWLTKLVLFFMGYWAALSALRAISRGFNRQMSMILGDWLRMGLAASLFLFVFCIAVFIIAVFKSKSQEIRPIWHKIDFYLLIVLTFCVVFLCIYYVWVSHYSSMRLLLLSIQALNHTPIYLHF